MSYIALLLFDVRDSIFAVFMTEKEMSEDTKWVIRSRKAKKEKAKNQKTTTDNTTNKDPQNTTQKTKEQHEPHKKSEVNAGVPER